MSTRSRAASRSVRLAAGAAFLLTCAGAADADVSVRTRWECPFPVAAIAASDLDGDGVDELVVIGREGEVRVRRRAPGGAFGPPVGALVLREPARALVSFGTRADGRPGTALYVVGPRGVHVHDPAPDGGFANTGRVFSTEARFRLRVGTPRLTPVVRDLNDDGLSDVLVPQGDSCQVWLQGKGTAESEASGPLVATRVATVAVELERSNASQAELLTDTLESVFSVPELQFSDVNGDERDDLVVVDDSVHAWHLQRADGSLPPEPDVRVDLETFRDTTPETELRLGRTLAGGDDQKMQSRDVSGDGIPDYVIAHRRKVWVFHGSSAGPQFERPAAVLKTAEDVTLVVLADVDGDDSRADLVLLRVQVPSAAGLLRGLLAEWSVEIGAVAYGNDGAEGFTRSPTRRGELSVRLPAILGIVRDPDALIQRFESAASSIRTPVAGDFDGDGSVDLGLAATTAEGVRLDVWNDVSDIDERVVLGQFDNVLRDVLFDRSDDTWTLDDVLEWISELGSGVGSSATGNRPADHVGTFAVPEGHERGPLLELRRGGRTEVAVTWTRPSDGRTVVDILIVR